MTTSTHIETLFRFGLFAAIVCLPAVVGCESKPADDSAPAAKSSTADPVPGHAATANRETLLVKLAKADEYDGKTDKIVSRCAGCGLGMDGSDKYVVEFEGYSLHLCNEACRKEFAGDTVNAVLAMRIPAAKPQG